METRVLVVTGPYRARGNNAKKTYMDKTRSGRQDPNGRIELEGNKRGDGTTPRKQYWKCTYESVRVHMGLEGTMSLKRPMEIRCARRSRPYWARGKNAKNDHWKCTYELQPIRIEGNG